MGADDGRERVPLAPAAALGLVAVAGVLGAVQPAVNAELASRTGHPVLASTANFVGGLLAVAACLAVRPRTRELLRGVSTWDVPRWTYLAGLGGATVVVSGAVAVGPVGVAVFSVAFFAGQVTFGLLIDGLGIG